MLLRIFNIFFRLGFIAFGGGYSIITILESEVVDKHNIIDKERFFDIVNITQGLPGAIGLNVAIFVGYISNGIVGALVAAAGSILPSLIIITSIMALFSNISSMPIVQSAMNGIRPVVVALVIYAAYKIGLHAYKSKGYVVLTVIGFLIAMFAENIPLPFIIIGGLISGILINYIQEKLGLGGSK
ncbi:MAG: chromate transporter [Clostridia bacterium]|jgi:chromate transporter|nr:chromate transporter [Clostridia bacterium]